MYRSLSMSSRVRLDHNDHFSISGIFLQWKGGLRWLFAISNGKLDPYTALRRGLEYPILVSNGNSMRNNKVIPFLRHSGELYALGALHLGIGTLILVSVFAFARALLSPRPLHEKCNPLLLFLHLHLFPIRYNTAWPDALWPILRILSLLALTVLSASPTLTSLRRLGTLCVRRLPLVTYVNDVVNHHTHTISFRSMHLVLGVMELWKSPILKSLSDTRWRRYDFITPSSCYLTQRLLQGLYSWNCDSALLPHVGHLYRTRRSWYHSRSSWNR